MTKLRHHQIELNGIKSELSGADMRNQTLTVTVSDTLERGSLLRESATAGVYEEATEAQIADVVAVLDDNDILNMDFNRLTTTTAEFSCIMRFTVINQDHLKFSDVAFDPATPDISHFLAMPHMNVLKSVSPTI